MSRRRTRSLRGRIEYDPYTLYKGQGATDIYTGRVTPYCTVRLSLYDLPPGAIVSICTVFELCAARSEVYRAHLVPVWQPDYRATFRLEERGRLKVEIRTKKHVHKAEYRIDPEAKRPVRGQLPGQRSKLEIRAVETLCMRDQDQDERPGYRREQPAPAFPAGSLWAV